MNLIKLFLVTAALFSSSAQAALDDLHLIVTSGVAEKSVDPNMVLIRVESWAKASTANVAQEQQSIQYSRIKAAVDKFKIKKEDVQTESFNTQPEYVWDQKNNTQKLSGYRVSHVVLLVYRKVEDAGSLLDSLSTSKGELSGINIQGIEWDYDKKSDLEAQVLTEAVKNARTKADIMAEAAGVIIKAVHKIQHASYSSPRPYPVYAKAMMAEGLAGDSVSPPSEVSGGKVKIQIQVQMEFEI